MSASAMMAPGHQNLDAEFVLLIVLGPGRVQAAAPARPHQPKRSARHRPRQTPSWRPDSMRPEDSRHSMVKYAPGAATKHQLDGNELSKLAAELGATLTELSRARALLGSGDDRSEVVPIPLVGHSGRPASARREASQGVAPAPTPSAPSPRPPLMTQSTCNPAPSTAPPPPLLAHRNPTMPSTPFVGLPRLAARRLGATLHRQVVAAASGPVQQWQAQAYTSLENNDPIAEVREALEPLRTSTRGPYTRHSAPPLSCRTHDPLEVVLQKRAQVAAGCARSPGAHQPQLCAAQVEAQRVHRRRQRGPRARAYTADGATEGEPRLQLSPTP